VNEGKKGPLASDSEGHSGMSEDSDEDEPVTASAAEKPAGASPANSPTPAKQRTAPGGGPARDRSMGRTWPAA